MTRILSVASLGGGVLAVLLTATAAWSAVITNQRLPFGPVAFVDQCTGETVDVSGEFHVVISEVVGKDGTISRKTRLTAHGEGTGQTSGNRYRWNDTVHTDIVDPDGPGPLTPAVDTVQTGHLRVIQLGKGDNLHRETTVEVHVDENGVVQFSSSAEFSCLG